ncbi:MAG TPA: ECF transporter S component [Terrimesophilobacter sp.]|nr:ECF transporter S component [Terrimesophilobacter sp.]HRP99172.1 ECF transporter S component [Terrimesophilobacter sp.]
MSATPTTTASKRGYRWRVVDIVVASVIAVASGVVFFVWNIAHDGVTAPLKALLPGLQALDGGMWLFAGVLVALVIRKPGAALFGEFVAASVSALLGGQYGATVLVSGLVQGLGAELVFAVFFYLNWRLGAAILAGIGAGIAKAVFELIVWYPGADVLFMTVYTVSSIVSGAVIAGVLSWLAVRALAKTGALDRFASGRETTVRV